ncbi:MAG TPA: FHA domain-containing protein [Burkholderiales bacterium]|nr:FHA domain-containing protein [Burkholderiales bacterium]
MHNSLERPAPPAAQTAERPTTVLFAEVSGAPAAQGLKVLGMAAELSGGRVLHQHANGVLALFSTPDAAAAAAARMHAYAQALPPADRKLDVRIGFHAGPVAQRNDDIFGDTVNLALLLAGEAKSGEILTSPDTASSLAPAVQELVRPARRMRVPGRSGELLLGELVWQDAVNQIVAARRTAAAARSVLRLAYRGKTLVRRRDGDTVSIGRDPECDLRVDQTPASRQHCAIERRGAAFVVRDHSTNGTFVTVAGQKEVHLHGQELALGKAGVFSLGQCIGAAEHFVHYVCTRD